VVLGSGRDCEGSEAKQQFEQLHAKSDAIGRTEGYSRPRPPLS
jgi:hypothetical protein